MGEHKITIEIISNPENNVLRPQNYTLQNYGQYSRILHTTSKSRGLSKKIHVMKEFGVRSPHLGD